MHWMYDSRNTGKAVNDVSGPHGFSAGPKEYRVE